MTSSILRRSLCALLCLCLMLTALPSLAAPKATPAPPTPEQQAALDGARTLVSERILALAGDKYHGFAPALADWASKSAALVTDKKTGVVSIYLYAPKFGTSAGKTIPVYKGADPLPYLQEWHKAMIDTLATYPIVTKGAFVTPLADKTDEAKLDAWIQDTLLKGLDKWTFTLLEKSKAIRAVSRLVFPVPMSASAFHGKQFAKGAGGLYDKKIGDTVAYGMVDYLAESDLPDAEALAKCLPIYAQTMRKAAWSMAEQGAGLTLNYQVPAKTDEAVNEYTGVVIRKYLSGELPKGDIPTFAAQAAGERMQALKIKDGTWEEKTMTVNLAAFALSKPSLVMEALGAEQFAGPLPILAAEMTAADSTFTMISALNNDPIPYPANGALLPSSGGNSRFTLRNKTDDPVYIKLERLKSPNDTGEGELIAALFVHAGKSAGCRIKAGYYYRISIAIGIAWFGEKDMFGENGSYSVYEKAMYIKPYYEYVINHIYETPDGKRKGDMVFNDVDLSDF